MQLGLKATAATWPPQWREMVQGFVSAFPSMAWLAVSKAQESTCFLAVRGWGVWVEKTVKLLKQLLWEAANADLVKYLSRVWTCKQQGENLWFSTRVYKSRKQIFSLFFLRSKMLLLQVKNSNDKMVSLPQLDFAVIKKKKEKLHS